MANERKDAALVTRGKTGDPGALNDLVGQYWRAAYSGALRILRSHEDAEDIAQDALLSAILHLPAFDERASFGTWLHRIIVNESIMLMRRKRSRALDGADALDENLHAQASKMQASPESEILDAERHHLLNAAIERLPARYRVPLSLFTLKEQSVGDIAQNLDISRGAVKIRLHRARKLVSRKIVHVSHLPSVRTAAAA
jgi:RNA polymerase sigma-70 factor (ECF subfamily)